MEHFEKLYQKQKAQANARAEKLAALLTHAGRQEDLFRAAENVKFREQLYRDECERVEVERRFSLAKRKCGMGLVTAKLRETAAHAIAISILVLNLRKIQCALLRLFTYLLEILSQKKNWAIVQ